MNGDSKIIVNNSDKKHMSEAKSKNFKDAKELEKELPTEIEINCCTTEEASRLACPFPNISETCIASECMAWKFLHPSTYELAVIEHSALCQVRDNLLITKCSVCGKESTKTPIPPEQWRGTCIRMEG